MKKSYKSFLPQILSAIDNGITKAHYIQSREVINDAKKITRVDTGALRDSYTAKIPASNKKSVEYSNTQSYYAAQELGTKHIKPMNALPTAITGRANSIAKRYGEQISAEIGKVK